LRRCTGICYTIDALEELMESGSLRRFGLVASAVPPTMCLGSLDFATISDLQLAQRMDMVTSARWWVSTELSQPQRYWKDKIGDIAQ